MDSTSLATNIGAGVLDKAITQGRLEQEIAIAIALLLDEKKATLWLDWDISQKERRALAVDKMTEFVIEVLEMIQRMNQKPKSPLPPPMPEQLVLPENLMPRPKAAKASDYYDD